MIMDYTAFRNSKGRLDADGKRRLLLALGRAPDQETEPPSAAERYRRNHKLDVWHAMWEHYGIITGISDSLASASQRLRDVCIAYLAGRGIDSAAPIHDTENLLGRDRMVLVMQEVGV